MTRVYPNPVDTTAAIGRQSSDSGNVAVLTVWKKSLVFNCSGFTVFDSYGDLVFRVDNYTAGNKGSILLMDSAGNPLFTILRKRLSLGDSWAVYEGENTSVNPRFYARKRINILNPRSQLAHLSSGDSGSPATYDVRGNYAQRSCAVYDKKKRKVAEVARKEGVGGVCLGDDVFRLLYHPHIDSSLAMAIVVLLDQMYEKN